VAEYDGLAPRGVHDLAPAFLTATFFTTAGLLSLCSSAFRTTSAETVLALKPHDVRRHDGLNQSLLNMLHLVCSDDWALRSVEAKSGRSRKDADPAPGTMLLKRSLQNVSKLVSKYPERTPNHGMTGPRLRRFCRRFARSFSR
jgi:hypothetical protein